MKDLLLDWINSEIPALPDGADQELIDLRDRRIAKAQALIQQSEAWITQQEAKLSDAQKQHAAQLQQAAQVSAEEIRRREQAIAELQQQVTELEAQIEVYRQVEASAATWNEVVDALDAAGFDEHLEAAVAAGVGAFGAATRIIAAVQVGDIGTIVKYWEILQVKFPASLEQLTGWQQVLDDLEVDSIRFLIDQEIS